MLSDNLTDIKISLKELEVRIAKQKQATTAKIHNLRTELRAEVDAPRMEVRASSVLGIHSDPCEILISGIPKSLPLNEMQVISALLSFMGLSSILGFVLDWRLWSPGRRSSNNPSSGSGGGAAPATQGLVIKLASSIVRDKIASAGVKLKGHKCAEIFQQGGDMSIFIRPLWPKPLYDLFQKVAQRSKLINYARPIIRDLIVFARQSMDSQLIPIFPKKDLEVLPSPPA